MIDFLCRCFTMLRSVSFLLDPGFRKPTRDAMLCAKQGCNNFSRTPSRMMPYLPIFAIIYQVSKKRSSDCFIACATKLQWTIDKCDNAKLMQIVRQTKQTHSCKTELAACTAWTFRRCILDDPCCLTFPFCIRLILWLSGTPVFVAILLDMSRSSSCWAAAMFVQLQWQGSQSLFIARCCEVSKKEIVYVKWLTSRTCSHY